MSETQVEWLGTSCGKHGSYTFYKGFKLTVNGQTKKYLLGEFYFVRNSKDRPICIAELQLVWHDANTGNQLASARLYFRPEGIPGGRQNTHGKDELLYTDEKVVVKCRDMIKLECDATDWCYGMKALSELNLQEVKYPGNNGEESTKKYRLCSNNLKSKNTKKIAMNEHAKIVILSFPAYCRYQSLMKKLASGLVLSKMAILAFGGIIQDNNSTWVSFSRESFHHPELDKFDMFSDNKAPVLKGRPRKKKTSKAKGHVRGKYKSRKNDNGVEQNIPDIQPKSPESESSDDNQTDTSEESSLSGVQELPCPPKLVSAIKEEPSEPNRGVICSVKHSALVDAKPNVIPPIPKLVKIEPKQNETAPTFKNFQQAAVKIEAMTQSAPVSICRMENIGATRMTPSPAKISVPSSVISSTYNTNNNPTKSTYRPVNNAQVHEDARGPVQTRVPHAVTAPLQNHLFASTPASSLQPTHVPHAGTITTNRNVRPRMSAIVSTGREPVEQDAVNRAVKATDKKPGNERDMECLNDGKQTLKRKRGRPPGKSTKFMKAQQVKGEEQVVKPKPTPLRPVEMNVSPIPVKPEQLPASPVDCSMLIEDEDSPEAEDASGRAFMTTLKNFMKRRGTPIEKIPALGFRKINLFKMFEVTGSLGGYDVVTAKRLWRRVYNEVGGSPSITSAATNSRKHYERLLLPYERYLKGQDPLIELDKPDTPPLSKESERISTSQRDQNANVIQKKESTAVLIPQSPVKKQVKPVVSASECIVNSSENAKESVEYISSGSRGSPIMLYSSPVDQRPRRQHEVSQPLQYESRPRVITSVGRDTTTRDDRRSSSPEIFPNDMRSYITEAVGDDELRMYIPQKSRMNDVRTPITEHERKYEYAPRGDHVTELRTRAQESRHANDRYLQMRANTPEITNEPREVYTTKVSRDPGDGVLMMNVRMSDGKVRSSHSQHDGGQYISTYAVPVLQQAHFPHGVELYDLPNGGFPLRTSSRIFMPSSHQLYPTSHPAATLSPYPPHIITVPETGAVYQLPMQGYFPQELPYQLEGVSILRS